MNSLSSGPGNQANEKKLVLRAQNGDAEAFGTLYSWYLDAIYRYVYFRVNTTETAEDLTEEVFVRAWEALPTYEVRKYPFKSWLYRIAHNLIIDHRRKQRPVTVEDEVLQAVASPVHLPEDIVVRFQNNEALTRAVRKLDGEEQQVVILRFVEGLSHREVAEIIGKSEEASRVIQYRAIQRLQRYMTDGEDSDE
jgi:RNA polymerase sigma-70 factor (ECF subfamily)